jgi:ABC-type uncharacterized transport system auxiliary subunit
VKRALFLLIAAAIVTGCFGARSEVRSYYVLAGEPFDLQRRNEPTFHGAVRVRNLNAEDVYDKFQIVVRKSPYELQYSDGNVWAVKPYQMVSDIIARRMIESNTFPAATRELGELRPEYTLGGELHAIEVYDSNDLWFAHLAVTLTLNRFADGERLWSMRFDERKQVATQSFSHAVRTISELLDTALLKSVGELERVARGERIIPAIGGPALPDREPTDAGTEATEDAGSDETIYLPERGSEIPR